jgi:hypothetical protein
MNLKKKKKRNESWTTLPHLNKLKTDQNVINQLFLNS